MFPLLHLLRHLWLEVMDPGLIQGHKSVGIHLKYDKIFPWHVEPSLFQIRSKTFWDTTCWHLRHMKFVVDDCMDVVLGDVMLCYSSVCHDEVMNFGNGLLVVVVMVTGLPRWVSCSRHLNSAAHFFTMLYKGAISSSVIIMSSWISLGVKPLRLR